MAKSYRQGQILKLIRSKTIGTQQELADALGKLGIQATQVTLSRDIHELGLAKTSEGYRQISAEPAGPDLSTLVGELLWDIRPAQNLVVLKTAPANASSLAAALDHAGWPEVVGTIAGDDTVLVVAPDGRTANELGRKLRELLVARE